MREIKVQDGVYLKLVPFKIGSKALDLSFLIGLNSYSCRFEVIRPIFTGLESEARKQALDHDLFDVSVSRNLRGEEIAKICQKIGCFGNFLIILTNKPKFWLSQDMKNGITPRLCDKPDFDRCDIEGARNF